MTPLSPLPPRREKITAPATAAAKSNVPTIATGTAIAITVPLLSPDSDEDVTGPIAADDDAVVDAFAFVVFTIVVIVVVAVLVVDTNDDVVVTSSHRSVLDPHGADRGKHCAPHH